MRFSKIIVYMAFCFVCGTVSAQKQENEAKQKEDQKILDAFFAEMDEVLHEPDRVRNVVKEIRKELKSEYRAKEGQLLDLFDPNLAVDAETEEVAKLRERLKVIVLHDIELTQRIAADPGRMGDMHQKIHTRFQEFQRANPRLAKDPQVQQKEGELMQKAANAMGLFGGRHQAPKSIAQTRKSLSTHGENSLPVAKGRASLTDSLAHPNAQEGPIQEKRIGLQSLLKLKWTGERLYLDRDHWNVPFAGRSQSEITSEVERLLEKRGVELSADDDHRHQRRMAQGSNVERLFHELRGNSGGHYSGGGNAEHVSASFRHSDMECRLEIRPGRFECVLQELTGTSRLMRIVESDKGLEILLLGDLVHRFRCSDDGVTVVEIFDDESLKFTAPSFAELYQKEPRFVEMRLFALWDHIGITLPASRFSPDVVDRLLEVLASDETQLKAEVDQLVADLDADRFTTREAAYKKLSANLRGYYDHLYSKKDDKSISVEVLARVKKLLSTNTVGEVSHRDAVVSALELDNNVDYLEELLTVIDDDRKKAIAEHLETIKASN